MGKWHFLGHWVWLFCAYLGELSWCQGKSSKRQFKIKSV